MTRLLKKKNNNKSYGLQKEREAKHMLEKEGWHSIRARGSFGLYDVVAMHPAKGWKLIQVKSTKQKYVSFKKDINKIISHKIPVNTQKEFWIWHSPLKGKEKKGWKRIVIC